VASRHFCLAAATPLPVPVVVAAVDEVGDDEDDDEEVDVDEELLELPHALSAVAATTSSTRNGERRRIMPPLSLKRLRTGRTARWPGRCSTFASGEERLPVSDHPRAGEAPGDGSVRPGSPGFDGGKPAQRTALPDRLSRLQDERDPLLLQDSIQHSLRGGGPTTFADRRARCPRLDRRRCLAVEVFDDRPAFVERPLGPSFASGSHREHFGTSLPPCE
jgi:hypothetical protein